MTLFDDDFYVTITTLAVSNRYRVSFYLEERVGYIVVERNKEVSLEPFLQACLSQAIAIPRIYSYETKSQIDCVPAYSVGNMRRGLDMFLSSNPLIDCSPELEIHGVCKKSENRL